MSPKKRLVLFLPHRADPSEGVRVCGDLTPLELLRIAAYPDREGYEVVLVDAMIHEDCEERVLEACEGALLFASSCILGYQVAHGAQVARKVRERHPKLPIIWGGWFPSVMPELYLEEGIADAVGLGQGELTFWEVVQAIEAGEDLAGVPGLAVLRDGELVRTEHRPVLGFDKLPPTPWHLLEYEAYAELQRDIGQVKVRHKYPDPPNWKPGTPVRGFSHCSSFGCPEPCTFCCSPRVTQRRWKAIPGRELAEELIELQERFGFNAVRFQDANFGVAEKRSRAFCEALVEAGSPFWWSAAHEIESIARYQPDTLDEMAASRCHMVVLGAESGSQEQLARIKKRLQLTDIEGALRGLGDRGIRTGISWIIGYPGESRESMLDTIRWAADIKHKLPRSASDIFPFRAIPGTEDFEQAVELGYQPPRTFEEWGSCAEYRLEVDDVVIPPDVLERWRRYCITATFYDCLVDVGADFARELMRKVSSWRLRNNRFGFPLEHKLFHAYVKLLARGGRKAAGGECAASAPPQAPAT